MSVETTKAAVNVAKLKCLELLFILLQIFEFLLLLDSRVLTIDSNYSH